MRKWPCKHTLYVQLHSTDTSPVPLHKVPQNPGPRDDVVLRVKSRPVGIVPRARHEFDSVHAAGRYPASSGRLNTGSK